MRRIMLTDRDTSSSDIELTFQGQNTRIHIRSNNGLLAEADSRNEYANILRRINGNNTKGGDCDEVKETSESTRIHPSQRRTVAETVHVTA